MRVSRPRVFRIVAVLYLCSVGACVPPPASRPQISTACVALQEGVQQLANVLLSFFEEQEREVAKSQPLAGIQQKLQSVVGASSSATIPKTVIDPFRVAETGEVLKVNTSIEILMKQKLGQKLGIFPMTPENLRDATYVVNGVIALANHPSAPQKQYHISASLFMHKTGKILGSSQVCVNTLDYQPLEIYKDSPVYIKDRGLETLVSSVKRGRGQNVEPGYLEGLTVQALLQESDTLYGNHEYQQALTFYEEAERRPDGKTMKVYAGLYNIYRLLQSAERSEKAFGRLVEVSVSETSAITVKLLFAVGVAQFIQKAETVREYDMWLRQISQYLARTPNVCLDVVGHASRSGPADYNDKLSALRAQFVQSLMQKTFPGVVTRSKSTGMGFRQNIVGGGTDDARDEIDRRVEFRLRSCA